MKVEDDDGRRKRSDGSVLIVICDRPSMAPTRPSGMLWGGVDVDVPTFRFGNIDAQ